jgi:drug/metabolite transporter (DMT)-like permease
MTAVAVWTWLLNVALDTAGQVAFKAAASNPPRSPGVADWQRMARQPVVWAGVACYVVEFGTWLAFLSLVPLSIAVLLASANIVTVMVAGRIVFHESGGPLRTTGILLIAVGVVVVGLGGL